MPPPRSIAFPLLCALAYAGGVVGYLPLLSLLLPLQVAAIAGPDRFGVLAAVLIVGAVAAAGANVLFGWLSDRSRRRGGGRRRWIAAGLAASLVSFAAIAGAHTPLAIGVTIVAFQFAINAVLAPLVALVAEEVPDGQTGLTTGLFAAGPPIASLVSLALAAPSLQSEAARLALVGGCAAACLAPLLLTKPRPTPAVVARAVVAAPRRDLAFAWLSRLLIQVAGAVVFADLIYLMEDPGGDGRATLARMGTLLTLANLAPLPVAVILGRWSDRLGRRIPFLVAAALATALGLAIMAGAAGWTGKSAGLLLFSIGWGSFLPLQVGQIMRLLPDPDRRGLDLGIVNLANTVPVLIGQALTWRMATPRHADPLLLTLAALTTAGGVAMLGVRGRR